MRFHVVALPHTVTSKEYNSCAYTMKVFNFCSMMTSLGHEVYHYGAAGSNMPCTEHVTVISEKEQAKYFGDNDWRAKGFNIKWDLNEPYWKLTNYRAAAEILSRLQKRDFICLIGGGCQKPIVDVVTESEAIAVEFGVGYYGVFSKYRVFESYTHQAGVYGKNQENADGNLYDAVIPNYYDPEDFPYQEKKGDYLLFLARVIKRKGIDTALAVAQAAGLKLVIAGQGAAINDAGALQTEEGATYKKHPLVEFVGYADIKKRAELMGGARALIQPTVFMEPFGGNVVEAQLCGTPVITTDYAAFSETVKHGVTGYRCHTLEQFVWACTAVQNLSPAKISEIARANYSIDRVRLMYQEYFQMLYNLWDLGWIQSNPDRTDMGWLYKV